MSKEFAVIQKAVNLSHEQLRKLAAQRCDVALCSDEQVRELVKQLMNENEANLAVVNPFKMCHNIILL